MSAPGYRTRYAPSPTGDLHMGHARTALVTWLRARAHQGKIVMRIEDLDPPRVRKGSADAIMRDHEWLGLDWDEGPFYQSDHYDQYEQALAHLAREGRVFPCTCTRREVQAASAPHEGVAIYPGTCHNGPSNPDRRPAFRFRMDEGPRFRDLLCGEIEGTRGDFIVRRSDGLWAYQLAVVIDDHHMGMTEVLRGDDLLDSTSAQVALYQALGWSAPDWLHLPLVLGSDGRRLAKRHGAASLSEYRDAGWSPERILGLLGHSLGLQAAPDPTDLSTLASTFTLDKIPRDPVVLPGPS